MRTVLILVVAFACVLAGPARAQEQATYSDAHLALARDVVLSAGTEEMLNDMMRRMAPTMADQIVAGGADRAFAERFVEIFLEEFAAEAPRIIELTAIAYAGAFNESQLRDIQAFYQSPTGRAFVEQAPEMTAAMMRAGTMLGEDVALRALQRLSAERQQPPMNP
jgi:uncharacterized protein